MIPVRTVHGVRPQIEGQLFVTAHWHKIFAACASPNTPFEKSVTITVGGEADQTTVNSIGLSLGVAGKYGSISAAISQKTAQKISFNASTTTTTSFPVSPTKDRTTIIWWQKVYTYTPKGQLMNHPYKEFPDMHHLDCSMVVYEPDYMAVQYPEPKKNGHPISISLTE